MSSVSPPKPAPKYVSTSASTSISSSIDCLSLNGLPSVTNQPKNNTTSPTTATSTVGVSRIAKTGSITNTTTIANNCKSYNTSSVSCDLRDKKDEKRNKNRSQHRRIQIFQSNTETTREQMKRLNSIRNKNPTYASELMTQGMLLVKLVIKNDLKGIVRVCTYARENELLYWFVSKAFKQACVHLPPRLKIIEWMLDNGITLKYPGMIFFFFFFFF